MRRIYRQTSTGKYLPVNYSDNTHTPETVEIADLAVRFNIDPVDIEVSKVEALPADFDANMIVVQKVRTPIDEARGTLQDSDRIDDAVDAIFSNHTPQQRAFIKSLTRQVRALYP